jgi:hypothetical protein
MAIPRRPLRGLKILVSAQNEWYTKPIPARCNADAGVDSVISINGAVFLDARHPKVLNVAGFVRKSVEEVRANIDGWLDRHDGVSGDTTGIVVMDIEHPHPSGLHTYDSDPEFQERVIKAFVTRAKAARLAFPNATLGFYGTLVPDKLGRPMAGVYKRRRDALVRAVALGMFDEVDCLVPVVYPRFGPKDPEAHWNAYEAYTRLAITGSRELSKSDGTKLRLVPFLGCWIANKNSKHNHEVLLDLPVPDPLDKTLGVQFDVLLEQGVRTAVVWVGTNTELIENKKVPNPHDRTVAEHVCFRGPPIDKRHPA